MENNTEKITIDLAAASASPSIIKVIGVGGGGGNAVNHMYKEGIHDVNFVVCNTDMKALKDSPVPVHLQLGKEGLGAGNRPQRARIAAEESIEEIRRMLDENTKMVFITAGMGGGTGTGAAPIIAREAKAKDILTVGIVTIPFLFEGKKKINQALDGVDELSKNVDALLVISNERLREIYPDLDIESAFQKADSILSTAAKSIAEIITMHGIINLDFQDVNTVLKNGGVAIMSTGYAEGEDRVTAAIQDALTSPLIKNTDIYHSKKILLSIAFCSEKDGETLMMEEMNEIHSFMDNFEGVETKFGLSKDQTLGKKIKITILATGFGLADLPEMKGMIEEREAKNLEQEAEDEQEKDDRMRRWYDSSKGKSGIARRSSKIYIFGLEDLDNEEIISLVELTPTAKRNKENYTEIKKKSEKAMAIEPQSAGLTPSGAIDFSNMK
ncbi:MAG: cell division protein FtsZ [Alloprevotella sp.]|nr:cell division protein FtsZ [Alloprevotella sp.]